jgi:hypothetical protein
MYLRHLAKMLDDAGGSDCSGNIRYAADRLFNAKNWSNPLNAIDAVLQRDHTGILGDQRTRLFGGLLCIP